MENTQDENIPDSTSLFKSLYERELAKQNRRIRQRQYRLMKKEKEAILQQRYDQLKTNFRILEVNYHLMSQQSRMHEDKAREYKEMCQALINQLSKRHDISSPIECIEIEECTTENDNNEITHEVII